MPIATWRKWSRLCLLGGLTLAGYSRAADLEHCAGIPDNDKRLACFDELAARQRAEKIAEPPPADPDADAGAPAEKSWLARHWELGPENKRGTFGFRSHMPTYLIATYTDSPNNEPYRPFQRFVANDAELSNVELAFQIGFKMKLAENVAGSPADLWFGYTQRSFWQAENREASSPFRETNYRPELMTVLPVDFNLLGLKARFVNLGLVHESNGQSSTLSRSWNRIYAQLGLEHGGFTLIARVWRRLSEDAGEDDNPDIIDYMGRGDITGTYRWRGHEFSALARYNPQSNKGAAQLGWAFPIAEHLKGYVQIFSGYGHSLIDYNHAQNTLGLGFLVTY